MKLRYNLLRAAVSPITADAMKALAIHSCRNMMKQAGNVTAMTDNSTGTSAASIAAVALQATKVAQSGSNLAQRTGFNTAIGTVNNALAVLVDYMNTKGYVVLLGAGSGYTQGDGTVAVAGTVPACTKTVTGVDGTGGDAMLRSEFNAAITRARNNLSTVVSAYNDLALALGVAVLIDNTGGSASQTRTLAAKVTANTAVAAGSVATSDLATKAAADAALTALANNVATVTAKINAILFNNNIQLHDTTDTVVLI